MCDIRWWFRTYPLTECLIGVKILLLQSPENVSMQSSLGSEIPSSAGGELNDVRIIGWIIVSGCYQYIDWAHWDGEREGHQVSPDSRFESTKEDTTPKWVREHAIPFRKQILIINILTGLENRCHRRVTELFTSTAEASV